MYLSKVHIKNFRNLKDVTVNLRSGLNVLVGRNNAGKTNIFKAIRQAIGPAGARAESIWLERDDFYRASADAECESTMSITLTFSDLSEQQRTKFYEIVDFDLTDLPRSTAVIRFESSWPDGKRQARIKRTGGPASVEPPEVPTGILESLPITFLPALRDAESCLAPGYRSRLAVLLQDLVDRQGSGTEEDIEQIYKNANEKLEQHSLIKGVKTSLQSTTKHLAGSDYAPSGINAAEIRTDRILRTLQVQMEDAPIKSLDANGLGYNNLLYIAVVLEHLKSPHAEDCPLLLVEEPEAHLHPQLTILLAEYLANNTPGAETPQTFVSTHSPVLASKIPPSRVHVLFTDQGSNQRQCNSLASAKFAENEESSLERMLDITRATLYFAKALILVEGISEALLLPILAKRLGHDLAKLHVSVIPICGVSFWTFRKILGPTTIGVPVAIVTDGDPPVQRGVNWDLDVPTSKDGAFEVCDRTTNLQSIFADQSAVKICPSKVTLEYDLAEAGDENATVMAQVWESCFVGMPGTFNSNRVTAAGNTRKSKALAAWRGICRAQHSGSKAEFAHQLAVRLDGSDGMGSCPFAVPQYLIDAIQHVVTQLGVIKKTQEPSDT